MRKQKNLIQKLQTEDGQCLTTLEDIGGKFQSVFMDLFTSSHPTVSNSLLENFTAIVTPKMNLSLTKAYSKEEIEKAIFEMTLGSPGPDGFPAIFFQKPLAYWWR